MSIKNFSAYSIESGMLSIDEVINQEFTERTKRAFLTDSNTFFGVPEFVEKCQKKGIIPVVGNVITIHEDGNRLGTLTLYAKDKEGFDNLKKIISSCIKNSDKEKMTTFDQVINNSKGLCALTGGHDTMFYNYLKNNDSSSLSPHLYQLSKVFGDDLYFEIQSTSKEECHDINKKIIEIAEKNSIPVFATNNNRMRGKAHHSLIIAKTKVVRGVGNKLDNSQRLLESDYIKKSEELQRDFEPYKEKISSIKDFINKFQSYDIFQRQPDVPSFPGIEDKNYFIKTLNTEFDKFIKKIPTEKQQIYRDKLEEEVSLIKEFGFENYFTIFIQIEKNRVEGQRFNLRGSAASFLVTHVLGLSDVDPIANGLLSERFLNRNRLERHELPDIDIESNDIDAILKFLVDSFGVKHTAYMSSASNPKAKTQVNLVLNNLKRDIEENPIDAQGNKRQYPEKDVKLLLKMLSGIRDYTHSEMSFEAIYQNSYVSKWNAKRVFNLQGDFNSKEFLTEYRKISNFNNIERNYPNVKSLISLIRNANSLVLSTNFSPGSAVVSDRKITDIFTTQFVGKDINDDKKDIKLAVEANKKWIEKLGLLKLDVLPNRYLHKLDRAYTALDLDWHMPFDNKEVFEMITKGLGATINQIKSPSQRELAKELGVENFNELVTFLAIMRPGVEKTDREKYIHNKRNGTTYSHPIMEEVLSSTHGILVFEEQIMMLSQKIFGLSKGESDDFRSLIKKNSGNKNKTKDENYHKLQEKMKTMQDNAIKENKIPKEVIQEAMDAIKKVQGYTFLKAHSLSYSALAYKQAYVDINHPAEYIQHFLLDSNFNHSSKSNEFEEYIEKTVELGNRTFLSADINRSDRNYKTLVKGDQKYIDPALFFVVKDDKFINVLLKERSKSKFENLYDFVERTLPKFAEKGMFSSEWIEGNGSDNAIYKRHLLQLIKSGAFDKIAPEEYRNKGVAYTRTALAASVDSAMDLAVDPFNPEPFVYSTISEGLSNDSIKKDEETALGYSPLKIKEDQKLKKSQSVEQSNSEDARKPRRPRP